MMEPREAPQAAAIFERNHLAVYRFLRRATGDGPAAEDLTQDVFLRIVRGLDRYEDRLRERAWVFRIARNVLLDRHRRAEGPPGAVPGGGAGGGGRRAPDRVARPAGSARGPPGGGG